jgi:hypothetical protein
VGGYWATRGVRVSYTDEASPASQGHVTRKSDRESTKATGRAGWRNVSAVSLRLLSRQKPLEVRPQNRFRVAARKVAVRPLAHAEESS